MNGVRVYYHKYNLASYCAILSRYYTCHHPNPIDNITCTQRGHAMHMHCLSRHVLGRSQHGELGCYKRLTVDEIFNYICFSD